MRLWQAANLTARDFRLETIGPAFRSSVLNDEGDGVYTGKVATPAQGWVAFFLEMTYPNELGNSFKFTTGVRVVPDVLPFEPPRSMESQALPGKEE